VLARYLLWRFLLAIPTTFAILLALFALVNLMPAGEGGGASENGAIEPARLREARRVFREHYGFHLPVFLNTRHRITAAEIEASVARIALPNEQTDEQVDEQTDEQTRLDGEDSLRDLGRYAVNDLVRVATDLGRDPRERDVALRVLPDCAKQIVRLRDPPSIRDAGLALNREIAPLVVDRELQPAERELLAAAWARHSATHAPRYARPVGFESLRVTFQETRFGTYLANVLRLDFGVALAGRQPVLPEFISRLWRSVWIGLGYLLVSFSAAIPLALFIESRRRRSTRRWFDVFGFGLYSLPSFFTALLLQRWLAAGQPFSWFPIGGFSAVSREEGTPFLRALDVAHHLWLPVWIAALPAIVVLTRLLRSSLADAMRADYLTAARARGVSRRSALVRHALRNALLPLATMFGAMIPVLIGGAASIEFMFDIPGVGLLLLDATLSSDYNVILAVTLFSALATQAGYLISDVLCARLDPRIRLGASLAGASR